MRGVSAWAKVKREEGGASKKGSNERKEGGEGELEVEIGGMQTES